MSRAFHRVRKMRKGAQTILPFNHLLTKYYN